MSEPFGSRSLTAMRELLDAICIAPGDERRAYAAVLRGHAADVADANPMRAPDGEGITRAGWSVALTARLAALLEATADDQPEPL